MRKCLRCGKPVTDENHVMCPECREWFRNKPIEIPDDDIRRVNEIEDIKDKPEEIETEIETAKHGEEIISAEGASLVYDKPEDIIDAAPGSDTNVEVPEEADVVSKASEYIREYEDPLKEADHKPIDYDKTIEETIGTTAIEEAEAAHAAAEETLPEITESEIIPEETAEAVTGTTEVTENPEVTSSEAVSEEAAPEVTDSETIREDRTASEAGAALLTDDIREDSIKNIEETTVVPDVTENISEDNEMTKVIPEIPVIKVPEEKPVEETETHLETPAETRTAAEDKTKARSQVSVVKEPEDPENRKVKIAVIAFVLVLLAAAALLLNMGNLFGKKAAVNDPSDTQTAQSTAAPSTTTAVTTAPATTAPATTAPATTAPATTAPATTAAPETQPAETQPAETQPAETQPVETQPAEPQTTGTEGMMFADSDSRYIAASELNGLSEWECSLARNEIFARHGWIFKDQSLYDYFSQFDWYNPKVSPANFDSSVLNDYERTNVNTIDAYEKAHGY